MIYTVMPVIYPAVINSSSCQIPNPVRLQWKGCLTVIYPVKIADGFISAMEYPFHEESLDRAAERFRYIYDKYLTDENRVFNTPLTV